MNIHVPLCKRRACVFSALPLLIVSMYRPACAQVIAPGDRVVVIRESPLQVQTETLTGVPAGATLRVERVNGNWLWVRFQATEGWVDRRHTRKIESGLVLLSRPAMVSLSANNAHWWTLSRGKSLVLQVESSPHPVDVFVFSDEGKASYEFAVTHAQGQARSFARRLGTTQTTIRWEPPDERQYYLVIDNSTFPDGGATGAQAANLIVVFLHDDPSPAEPVAGRGLIIGRVTLAYEGFEKRNGRYNRPLTVHIAHSPQTPRLDDLDSMPYEVLKAVTDAGGFFALANVPLEGSFWISKVEGHDFTASARIRLISPINSSRGGAEQLLYIGGIGVSHSVTQKKTDVLDIGELSLSVTEKSEIHGTLSAPFFNGIRTFRDADGNVKTELGWDKDNDAALDRHRWFEKTYPGSGWITKVRSDRAWIENYRTASKEKQKEKEGPRPAPPAPAPPKEVPPPPPAPAQSPKTAKSNGLLELVVESWLKAKAETEMRKYAEEFGRIDIAGMLINRKIEDAPPKPATDQRAMTQRKVEKGAPVPPAPVPPKEEPPPPPAPTTASPLRRGGDQRGRSSLFRDTLADNLGGGIETTFDFYGDLYSIQLSIGRGKGVGESAGESRR